MPMSACDVIEVKQVIDTEDLKSSTGHVSNIENELINDMAGRAVPLEIVLNFLCSLLSGQIMDFDPSTTTTGSVVFDAIIPLTASRACAFATIVNEGEACLPDAMVSHAWDNKFVHMVAAIIAHFAKEPYYFAFVPRLASVHSVRQLMDDLGPAILKKTVWLCIFGVNQHISICKCHKMKSLNGDPLCEMDKFDRMLRMLHAERKDSFRQIVALGKKGYALSRAWVVAEIAACLELFVEQSVQIHYPLAYGHKELKSALHTLDVRKCQASRPEDKDRILEAIQDKDHYNHQIRCLLENAIDKPSRFAWMLPVLGLFLYAGIVCPIVLASILATNSDTADRVAFSVGEAVSSLPMLSPYPVFLIVNGFALDAVMLGDRLGVGMETLAQIPRGPAWLARVWYLYKFLASHCGGKPGRLRTVGKLLAAIGGIFFAAAIALLVDCSLGAGGWVIAQALIMVSLFLFCIGGPLYWPLHWSPKLTVTCLAVAGILLSGFAMSWMARLVQDAQISWCWTATEKYLLTAGLAVASFVLYYPAFDVASKFVRPQVREPWEPTGAQVASLMACMDAWLASSLRIRNVPKSASQEDLEDLFSRFSQLLGVFRPLGHDMCPGEMVIVTYKTPDRITDIFHKLDEFKYRGASLRPERLAQTGTDYESTVVV